MAAFFGEVIPVVSRAVDEDDEDEGIYYPRFPDPEIVWNISDKDSLECRNLIISVGVVASVFLEAYYVSQDNSVVLGSITSNSKQCNIYQQNQPSHCLVCLCKDEIQQEQAFHWTEKLLSNLKLNNAQVTVLHTTAISDYKSDKSMSDIKIPLIRALKTERCDTRVVHPYLEQPNTVSGLPAQILSYCQIKGVSCILYQSYTESIHIDSTQVNTFKSLQHSQPLSSLTQLPKAKERLTSLLEKESSDNLLYL